MVATTTTGAAQGAAQAAAPAKGTIRLLFSPVRRRDAVLLLPLGLVLSLAGGVIPALTSRVLGQAFDAFTTYNPANLPTSQIDEARRHHLLHAVVATAWQLCLLAAATLILNTAMVTVWIVVGEKVAAAWRASIYASVVRMPMAWFDQGMGLENAQEDKEGSAGGAGGLMARFARDTDDVRIATSQNMGQLVHHLATILACLVVAFSACWSLTFAVLASIPITMAITIAVEVVVSPTLERERVACARASGIVERSVNAIATVKAFGAQRAEAGRLELVLETVAACNRRLAVAWATRLGLTSALSLSMFTSGFAYGSALVQQQKVSAGTVMTVFWAALVAASQIQSLVQGLNFVEKGKSSAAALVRLTTVQQGTTGRRQPAAAHRQGGAVEEKADMEVLDDACGPASSPFAPGYSTHSPSAASFSSSTKGPSHVATACETDIVGVLPPRAAGAVVLPIGAIPHSPPLSSEGRDEKGNAPLTEWDTSASPTARRGAASRRAALRMHPKRCHHAAAAGSAVVPMRKVRPSRCHGEVGLRGVCFAYPTRTETPVLNEVSLYFAAGETTYVVGGSGSGKSTVAQLLLRLYDPDAGSVEIDEQDVRFLDPDWVKSCVSSVDQSPIIFDLSVHDNVALGRAGDVGAAAAAAARDANHVPLVSRDEVMAACRMALLYDFVQGLPDGFDTVLGTRGASLSGGQKQRLALARARLRDSPILILDEATSALDPTSRLLVNEAVKQWRRGKTTIIITHDLASVGRDEYVYVMEGGGVAEHGYRYDLEDRSRSVRGPFSRMLESQGCVAEPKADVTATPAQPTSSSSSSLDEPQETVTSPTGLEDRASTALENWTKQRHASASSDHARAARWAQGLSFGLDPAARRVSWRLSGVGSSSSGSEAGRASTVVADAAASHRKQASASSLSSTSSTVSTRSRSAGGLRPLRLAEQQQKRHVESEGALEWLEGASIAASQRRPLRTGEDSPDALAGAGVSGGGGADLPRPRRRWDQDELLAKAQQQDAREAARRDGATSSVDLGDGGFVSPTPSIWRVLHFTWRTQPYKPLFLFGLLLCVAAGVTVPLFSYVLGKLLGTMGLRDQQPRVRSLALLVLGLALIDGLATFARFLVMKWTADVWVRKLRRDAFAKVLAQDKAWFDDSAHSSGHVVTRIVKDGDDAQLLVGRVCGELVQIVVMVTLGLVWAMAVGWQLTLVGLAFAPVFVLAVAVQSRYVSRREALNKARREDVAKRFFDMAANVRGIRSMSLDAVFSGQFLDAVRRAERCGIRAAPLSGVGLGLGEALTYVAEALMYYVGARLILAGEYDFTRMVVTFNLIIFAVTFGAQSVGFLPGLSKSTRATWDLGELVRMGDETTTTESRGDARPARVEGRITFDDVRFAYPNRREAHALAGVSFSVAKGQRVALVGASGSGKSTVAALLQRLYEPDGGRVMLDGRDVSEWDVDHLRRHLAVVSQHPDLFDGSVVDNLTYGLDEEGNEGVGEASSSSSPSLLRMRAAARAAYAESFIDALPQGFATPLGGDRQVALSGGQAQRLAVARALLRLPPARVLVLDECTSALDAESQAHVVRALLGDGDAEHHDRIDEAVRLDGYDVADDAQTSYPTRARRHVAPPVSPRRRRHGDDPTVLCVTHKLDVMRRCDVVVVLEAGRVVQQGSYEELAAQRGGAFARLASAGEWGS